MGEFRSFPQGHPIGKAPVLLAGAGRAHLFYRASRHNQGRPRQIVYRSRRIR